MTDRQGELGAFLRARRNAISPADAGLPDRIGRRRTAGLRREEVAILADVSASWYTWLEQGRPVHPSSEVLDALARALRLDHAGRRHLFALAGRSVDDPVDTASEDEIHRLQRVLDLLAPAPAYAMTTSRDVVAWNAPMLRLLPELGSWEPGRRNLLWMVWCEPSVRSLLADPDGDAVRLVAEMRADHATIESDLTSLITRIGATNAEFSSCWEARSVADPVPRVRHFRHPWAGELRFETQELTVAGHPSLRVTLHLPLEGDDSTDRLMAWPTLP